MCDIQEYEYLREREPRYLAKKVTDYCPSNAIFARPRLGGMLPLFSIWTVNIRLISVIGTSRECCFR